MYWLRRIPAETRIVVLVVFLALFQAILLSVFGLGAIEGERSQADRELRLRAEHFLNEYVVARCQNGLRDRADEVFAAAFDRADAAWSAADPVPGRGIFTDALRVAADGTILSPDNLPLVMPRSVADARLDAARARARELRGGAARGDASPGEILESGLEFARGYPFARDDMGGSLSLLFASTPLLHPEGPPEVGTLLRIRWIAVLNRLAGFAPAGDVARVLARADELGGTDAAFVAGRDEQERRARIVAALDRERARFAVARPPSLHRNAVVGPEFAFYVRRTGAGGAALVLAVDRARLGEFLGEVVASARRAARAGVEPLVLREGVPYPDGPHVDIPELPGYVAAARISPAEVRGPGNRERFYWYIIAFSVAGILAGGFLTARVVMREVKLAKLKSGFVSNVSHELKTPLTSIRMFAEMLRSGKVTEPAERAECLDVISNETDRLGALIQKVLDFGRLDARRRRFDWVVGSLRPVVEKEAQRFRRAIGLSAKEFEVQVAVNLPDVVHDPDALGEVVTNLLSNAYKYSPADGRLITLLLGPQRGRLLLIVEDNGPGVPARERKKIFEQFYRAGDLLTREVEGTGLGLSIVRNIVRAHGGRIRVEDAAGGGARFVVALPPAGRRARGENPQ